MLKRRARLRPSGPRLNPLRAALNDKLRGAFDVVGPQNGRLDNDFERRVADRLLDRFNIVERFLKHSGKQIPDVQNHIGLVGSEID